MTATYEKIATTTLTGTTASYTFTSIPGTFTDLVLTLGNLDVTDAAQNLLQFNSDTGSNYSRTTVAGDGANTSSGRTTNATSIMLESTFYPSFNGNKDYTGIWNIMNYSNTTTYKTVIGRGSSASVGAGASVSLWRSTSAITSIKIQPAYGYSYNSGGVFTLYGIKAE